VYAVKGFVFLGRLDRNEPVDPFRAAHLEEVLPRRVHDLCATGPPLLGANVVPIGFLGQVALEEGVVFHERGTFNAGLTRQSEKGMRDEQNRDGHSESAREDARHQNVLVVREFHRRISFLGHLALKSAIYKFIIQEKS
jgi:hypothetical protein